MQIYVDGDACPKAVKEILYRCSEKRKVAITFVANQYLQIPKSPLINVIVVSEGPDEADNHIVEIMSAGDLVITADIPLADRAIKKKGVVLDPRGMFLDKETIENGTKK